ncbi:MAG: hypothetical protein HN509_18010 [Halobacteriovoraceae bacterium]|jgi:hypothetical protein|nr:hypothetical protein [Halobacteriovoraceae bacterium]MBT5094970.1 hypothetical protein [Halobacteriovoraceae bacterium]
MGDAYTAVADDDSTLFYNPAALGRHHGVSVYLLNPTVESVNYLKYEERLSNFPKEPAEIADKVLGIPLYLRLAAQPTLKFHHLGMTAFINSKTSLTLENAIHPTLDIDYRLDRGFVMGYSFILAGNKGAKRQTSGPRTSLGVGIKNMNRQGLSGEFDLFGTELLEVISDSSSYKEIRQNMGFSKGSGWGVDIGMEQTFYKGNSNMNFGLSLLDIGNTRFNRSEGTQKIAEQEMSLNFGSAWTQDFKIFDYTLAADVHPINTPLHPMSKLHLGLRAGLPFLKIYGGWNGGYVSYGAAIDLYLFRLTVGFYGVEVGRTFKEKEAERILVQLNLLKVNVDL